MSHLSSWIGRTEPWCDATSEKPNGDAPTQIEPSFLFLSVFLTLVTTYSLMGVSTIGSPTPGFTIGCYGTPPLLGSHPTCLLLTSEKMSRSDFMIT